MKKSKIIFFKRIIEYYLLLIIYFILNILPINFSSNLGAFIFKLIGPLTRINNTVENNLKIIFPNSSTKEHKIIANKSWNNTGKTFFELLFLHKILNKKNKISIQGKSYLDDIKKNKEKVIFIGIHQSNWEILLPTIDRLGIPLTGIYRHVNNIFIDKFILRIRSKSIQSNNSFYTPKGKKSARDILQTINNHKSIILLIDQKDSAGEKINLFNHSVKTQIAFIKIARKYKMKIIPIQNIRNSEDSFNLIFHKPLKIYSNNLSDNKNMEEIHLIIESWIKENPSDWLLQHNRFN